uniref:hypothetical protein n=1 Tax=Thermogemmatispora sp. TaxID=1968838 RepID=UPI0035E41115
VPPFTLDPWASAWCQLCDALQASCAWVQSSSSSSVVIEHIPEVAERVQQWPLLARSRDLAPLLDDILQGYFWLFYLGPDLLQLPTTGPLFESFLSSLQLHQRQHPQQGLSWQTTPRGAFFLRWSTSLSRYPAKPSEPVPGGGSGYALLSFSPFPFSFRSSTPSPLLPPALHHLLLSLHRRHSFLFRAGNHSSFCYGHLDPNSLFPDPPPDPPFNSLNLRDLRLASAQQLLSLSKSASAWQLLFDHIPTIFCRWRTLWNDLVLELLFDPLSLARLSPSQALSFALSWASLWFSLQAPYAFLVRLGFLEDARPWPRFAFEHVPLLRSPSLTALDPLLQDSARFHWLTYLGSPLLLSLDSSDWLSLLSRLLDHGTRLFLFSPFSSPLPLPTPQAAPPLPPPDSGLLLLYDRFAPGIDADTFLFLAPFTPAHRPPWRASP